MDLGLGSRVQITDTLWSGASVTVPGQIVGLNDDGWVMRYDAGRGLRPVEVTLRSDGRPPDGIATREVAAQREDAGAGAGQDQTHAAAAAGDGWSATDSTTAARPDWQWEGSAAQARVLALPEPDDGWGYAPAEAAEEDTAQGDAA